MHSTEANRGWPSLNYDEWSATCDTLHAHTQVLGKLATELAPPEPQFQHAALRLTPRGRETAPLPAPDASGTLTVALDLHSHEVVIEHDDGRQRRVPLTPNRSVGEVTREVLYEIGQLVGPVHINPAPQEVPWAIPLDEDDVHHTYDEPRVATYFVAATRAARVLAELRAPFRGRSSPVNVWWGSFDLATNLFSGRSVDPPSNDFIVRNSANAEQIAVGWWPGDTRHVRAAFFGYAFPAPESFPGATLSPPAAYWDNGIREYVFDWDDVIASRAPHDAAVQFGRSLIAHACSVCSWDPILAASARGDLPAIS